ncbi:unnamed protein product [Rangifer tarandus platyrhynchus]|uniref:Uncharacterized protein n=1 Tax=Rangifer tarandus platyrhynchus TaxID=3082113 RepID=A0AC59ZRT1_RANTA
MDFLSHPNSTVQRCSPQSGGIPPASDAAVAAAPRARLGETNCSSWVWQNLAKEPENGHGSQDQSAAPLGAGALASRLAVPRPAPPGIPGAVRPPRC